MTETAIAPWLDNWAIQFQLWQGQSRSPGAELNLIPQSRNLSIQFRNETGSIVVSFSEFDLNSPIRVLKQAQGLIELRLSGSQWDKLKPDTDYTAEILAYGYLRGSFPFRANLPQPHHDILGGELYAPPSQIVMTLSPIPGADVQTAIDLSGGWTLNAQGYWTKTIAQPVYGLWIDGQQARSVGRYEDLAADSARRSWAKVGNTIYLKCPDDLSFGVVETCHNAMVLRWLHEATVEVERRTGQYFNLRRVYREVHRGRRSQRQIWTRIAPVTIDSTFRLDCYSYNRQLYRRYTEQNFDRGTLHCDGITGTITVNQDLYDWWDWGESASVGAGMGTFAYLPRGENNIELTYLGGAETVPVDIAQATAYVAAKKAAAYWSNMVSGGLSALSVGCVNLNFSDLFSRWMPQWDAAIDQIIGNYQRLEIEAF